MAQLPNGLFGGISGKLGTLVGFYKNGKFCLKTASAKVNNPKTDKQLLARMRFSLISKISKALTPTISVGFHSVEKMTACNLFMRENNPKAISGTYPNLTVEYKNIVMSHGTLPFGATTKAIAADGMLSISWTDNTGIDTAMATDTVSVGLYNTVKGEGLNRANIGITRKNGCMIITTPERWKDDTFVAYLLLAREDFSNYSDTLFLGTFVA